MDGPLPGNTSGTARLLLGAPSYAVGWQEPIYVPNPAPGATWSHTVDGRFHERLISARWSYAASAVVANRYPLLSLSDVNGTVILRVPVMQTIVAGNNLAVNLWVYGSSQFGQNQAEQFNGLPDVLAPPGYTWTATTPGMDAGDVVSGVVLLVQRYPNDAAEIAANG